MKYGKIIAGPPRKGGVGQFPLIAPRPRLPQQFTPLTIPVPVTRTASLPWRLVTDAPQEVLTIATQWKFSISCFSGGQVTKIAEVQSYATTAQAQQQAQSFMAQHSCGTKQKLLGVSRLGAPGETWAGKWKTCAPCSINTNTIAPGKSIPELAASMK